MRRRAVLPRRGSRALLLLHLRSPLLAFRPGLWAFPRGGSLADRGIEDGLRIQFHEVLLERAFRHAGAIAEELLHVLLTQVRCETPRDTERDPALCQGSENLGEPPGNIRDLDAEGH